MLVCDSSVRALRLLSGDFEDRYDCDVMCRTCWGVMILLGGCVVSSAQYASFVSAINWLFHLICRCRGVFSRRGGRGKLWTLSLGGMVRSEVHPNTSMS